MELESEPAIVQWRIHLTSPPQAVHQFLSTNGGRACFRAESAVETNSEIVFTFPNGQVWCGILIENSPPNRFSVAYLDGSIATFVLADDGTGGTDLTLTDVGGKVIEKTELIAGWVSVLLALKAAVDFSVDLRNQKPQRTWDQSFVDH